MKCDRCKKDTTIWTMSYFNTDKLCPECEQREIEHPDFKRAKNIELEHCLRGNLNFPGIGLPDDLA